jgi:hypothetical protein
VAGERRRANKPPARYPCVVLNISGDGDSIMNLSLVLGGFLSFCLFHRDIIRARESFDGYRSNYFLSWSSWSWKAVFFSLPLL